MASERMPLDLASDRLLNSFGPPEQRRLFAQQGAAAKRNKRIALFPIVFFQIYLALSVLVFAFGPWPWPVSNPLQLYTFLFLAQAALFAGYRSALRAQPRFASTKLRVPTLVIVSLACNFLWIGQTYKTRTAQTTFGLDEAVSAVDTGLRDPGRQYDDKQKNSVERAESASTLLDYATLLLSPIMFVAFPLGIFFWKQLPVWARSALVAWIMVDLSMWIAIGTNKGIADFVLLLPCLLVARRPVMLVNVRPRNWIVIGLITIVGLVGLFTFFSLGLLGRSRGLVVPMYDNAVDISADPENLTLRYFSPEMQGSIASFTSYFIQGYYALSLSLEQPFVFCYGVGNSFFLEGLSRRFLSEPVTDYTYPARIEGTGWDRLGRWHSIYPWIASDLSFPGTIVFIFMIGRLFALVWLDVAFARNPWAVCLLPLLLTMLFYIPANNQVLGYGGTAIPFGVLLCIWLFTRRAKRRSGRRMLWT